MMILIELKRAFKNKFFVVSLAIGVTIALAHFFLVAIPVAGQIDALLQYEKSMTTVANVFSNWMGGNTYNIYGYIFYLLLPILATIPFADSFYSDNKSGFDKNILIRTSKFNYLRAKYIAVFISGGAVFLIPLILNFLLCAAILPALTPQVVLTHMGLLDTSMFFELYFTHPYLYFAVYAVIDFLFAGLFACITLVMSIIAQQHFVALIAPFIIYIFINSVCELIDKSWFSPLFIAKPAMPYGKVWITILELLILFILSFFIFVVRTKKHDTY